MSIRNSTIRAADEGYKGQQLSTLCPLQNFYKGHIINLDLIKVLRKRVALSTHAFFSYCEREIG